MEQDGDFCHSGFQNMLILADLPNILGKQNVLRNMVATITAHSVCLILLYFILWGKPSQVGKGFHRK